MQINKKSFLLVASGAVVVGGMFAGVALARGEEDENPIGISAPVLVRAINAASAAKAGDIAEASVEKEKGKTLVSVDVLAKGGQKYEVNVDPATAKVLSVEVDKDDDKEAGEKDGDKD